MAESNSKQMFSPDLVSSKSFTNVNICKETLSKSKQQHLSSSESRVRGVVCKKTEKTKAVRPRSNQKVDEGKSNGKSRIQSSSSVSLSPKGYTYRPIVPASKAELLPVAHAMHGEDFAPRLKKLFDPEREAALEAIKTGIYIGWRCPNFKHDCIRVGKLSKCFCGHLLVEHRQYDGHSFRVPCAFGECKCKAFSFVPSRAEEVGEFWLQRRGNYDPTTWRAKCKCKHTHEEHAPNGIRRCRAKGCRCSTFFSNFLCCACDKHWEEHETVFETTDMRKSQGIPYGDAYLPFNELPELRNLVLTGRDDDDGLYQELTSGPYAIPNDAPSPLALKLRGENNQSAKEKGSR